MSSTLDSPPFFLRALAVRRLRLVLSPGLPFVVRTSGVLVFFGLGRFRPHLARTPPAHATKLTNSLFLRRPGAFSPPGVALAESVPCGGQRGGLQEDAVLVAALAAMAPPGAGQCGQVRWQRRRTRRTMRWARMKRWKDYFLFVPISESKICTS